MRNYDLTYIISTNLSEEELRSLSEKINKFIQEENGKKEKTIEPSREKLGYFIKKREEGFLTTINFSLNPEKLASLEKKLRGEKQILRYLILTKKPEKVSIRRVFQKKERPLKIPPKITKPKKVELEEIDKKIEEILR